jgi:hypothetical protein
MLEVPRVPLATARSIQESALAHEDHALTNSTIFLGTVTVVRKPVPAGYVGALLLGRIAGGSAP